MENNRFFKLILLIVVFTYIIFLINLRPLYLLSQSRNVKRWRDINAILDVVYLSLESNYLIKNNLINQEFQLGSAEGDCNKFCPSASNKCLSFSTLIGSKQQYAPIDSQASNQTSGYSIKIDNNRVVTIKACLAEGGEKIELSR